MSFEAFEVALLRSMAWSCYLPYRMAGVAQCPTGPTCSGVGGGARCRECELLQASSIVGMAFMLEERWRFENSHRPCFTGEGLAS